MSRTILLCTDIRIKVETAQRSRSAGESFSSELRRFNVNSANTGTCGRILTLSLEFIFYFIQNTCNFKIAFRYKTFRLGPKRVFVYTYIKQRKKGKDLSLFVLKF